ncbi:helix-turn-helix domain-containing protein [Vibrio coralliilyticus]|uniref:helix-turn-helix domain-containing protein n=1 Tax=Vibrio coralliilyticus TaxID=190893 RepID=UPI0006CCCB76|nr:helix-turn-helix domain-containing protein [Vibrio coralliilyticus]AXN30086.1 AraC family transcriptional regulator [Vibrio coralliilyticus]KPH25420.1 AraC family transcriptional regulator [Vibrio coralliilyticus]NOI28161.1 AraC family transcriptional regulator [Vibrio coralliilyticus]NOI49102.1 AraC family transcriptional regulator [Vibrio coralliilyticus]WFB47092.1 helix-turn-helix domain-containing protein [Vibrio coralliilyticus]
MDFEIVNPDGLLADHVQAIWSAKVSCGQAVSKPLYCDGGSGVMFVLQGLVGLEGRTYGESVMYQPYSRVTKNITISCEAQLCGVRFHPGMQFSFLEELVEANKANHQDVFCFEPSEALVKQLSEHQSHNKRIALLMDWCLENVSQIDTDIDRAKLIHLAQDGKIGESFGENQRQVERKFKHWVGMSPKHFQRLRRVHASIQELRDNPELSLAELAAYQGFSDQAHMTREFKNFALITPGQFSRRLKQK